MPGRRNDALRSPEAADAALKMQVLRAAGAAADLVCEFIIYAEEGSNRAPVHAATEDLVDELIKLSEM